MKNWCNMSETKFAENYNSFDIWHARLGQPSMKIIRHVLSSNNKVHVENISSFYTCTYCPMGKSHKLAFPDSKTKYDKPLKLVATDL